MVIKYSEDIGLRAAGNLAVEPEGVRISIRKSSSAVKNPARIRAESEFLQKETVDGVLRLPDEISETENEIVFSYRGLSGLPESGLNPLRLASDVSLALHELHRLDRYHGEVIREYVFRTATGGFCLLYLFNIPLFDLNTNLRYMAPERLTSAAGVHDSISDLYSAGVLFYRISTGSFPFAEKSADEAVHDHFTKKPQPPNMINKTVSRGFSDLICRLLAKDPIERYKTAWGLRYDLQMLLRDMEFTPGAMDASAELETGSRLFGRETEMQRLSELLHRGTDYGLDLILIGGEAGVGKTMLVSEVLRSCSELGPVTVKCSVTERFIPFSLFSVLFNRLLKSVLKSSDTSLVELREKIRTESGGDLPILTAVLPELEILEDNPRQRNLSGIQDLKQRQIAGVNKLLRLLLEISGRMIIFIDDIQWIDQSSMEILMSSLYDTEISCRLAVIFAFREKPVLLSTVDETVVSSFRKQIVCEFNLQNLTVDSTAEYLSSILYREVSDCWELAVILQSRTGGNPFYIKIFLNKIRKEGSLVFDYEKQNWQWDIAAVSASNPSENVVELLLMEMKRLTPDFRELLSCAALFVDVFTAEQLAEIFSLPVGVLRGMLISCKEPGYLTVREGDRFCFVHDKIRNAAYSLTPPDERNKYHLAIARMMLKTDVSAGQKILRVAEHYNRGRLLIKDREELETLLRLNIDAAQHAKAQAAWQLYADYSMAALRIEGETSSGTCYRRRLLVYGLATESLRVISDYNGMEKIIAEAVEFAVKPEEKVKFLKEMIPALTAKNRMSEAVETAEQLINLLGRKRGGGSLRLYFRLFRKDLKYFKSLKPLQDPEIEAVFEVIMHSFAIMYLVCPDKFGLFINKSLWLLLRYGSSSTTPVFLCAFGTVAIKDYKMIKLGSRFGRIAFELSNQETGPGEYAMMLFIFGMFIQHWTEPIAHAIRSLDEAVGKGIEAGNTEYATLARNTKLFLEVASGRSLRSLLDEKDELMRFHLRHNYGRGRSTAERTYGFIENIAGLTEGTFSLCLRGDDDSVIRTCLDTEDQSGAASYFSYKLIISYYYGDYESAAGFADKAGEFVDGLDPQFTYVLLVWFRALARLRLPGKGLHRGDIKRDRKLIAFWASRGPANHLHRRLLLDAEIARVRGRKQKALRLYSEAARTAAANGYIQDKALSLELAGKLYSECGNPTVAGIYLQAAVSGWNEWGAVRKADQLKAEYSKILRNPVSKSGGSLEEEVLRRLDISSLIAVSQAISTESFSGDLPEAVLKTVITNSGAEEGVLFLVKDGRPESSAAVPASACYHPEAVEYCMTYRKALIIDGRSCEIFSEEELKQKGIRSLLCMPLTAKGELKAVLYLENRMMPGVFSSERIAMLNYLSGQIAVTLENAGLYESLQNSYSSLIEAEKLASLGVLAASITHEVSNPNYAIHLNAEFLESCSGELLNRLCTNVDDDAPIAGLEPEEFRKKFARVIETILDCSGQIDGVIKELKRYIRRDPDEKRRPVSVDSLISASVKICRDYIQKSTDNFEVLTGGDIPDISVHQSRIQQVLINLIINGCQALTDRSSLLRIETEFNAVGRIVYIRVIDQGVGIMDPPGKLVTPFYSTKGGLGLGLSISEEILKIYDGRLDFKKNEYSGTTVTVAIPVGKKEGRN